MDRRSFIQLGAVSLAACALPRRSALTLPRVDRPIPSAAQLQWHRDELAMFLHFGVNTFTNREWGDGTESPSIFNPTALDTYQWARVAKRAGVKAMILTAKHHDGFCLWPTKTTTHSVASSPFRGGQGDVVREFVNACRSEGLRAGLYLSPWDRNHPAYGDSARYNAVYIAQLTELLTQYGEIAEVWFDGANGEGPNGKKQVYDWPRFWGHVKSLQPNAVIFSDAGPDVRWCGNERGTAGDPNWATVDPAKVPFPGADGPGIVDALQHGDPHGTVWRPAEVDVSIRPGWFYHAAEDSRVRSVENLVDLYCTSVGRNGKLLLNVPPTTEGLIHSVDAGRLAGMRDALDRMFSVQLAPTSDAQSWSTNGSGPLSATMELREPAAVSVLRLGENITRGQIMSGYTVSGEGMDGAWHELSRGTTIGHAKIDRIAPTTVRRIRLSVESSVAEPEPVSLRVY
jgi:alpha-L-fucosidase